MALLSSSRRFLSCSFNPVSLIRAPKVPSCGTGSYSVMRGFSTRYWSNGWRMSTTKLPWRSIYVSSSLMFTIPTIINRKGIYIYISFYETNMVAHCYKQKKTQEDSRTSSFIYSYTFTSRYEIYSKASI